MESKSFGNNIDPSVYTDFGELSKLKSLAAQDSDAALKEVAQQFEQVFMNMMLKSMRQANEAFAEDDPFNSSEVQFYQGMLDQQLSLNLANAGGMGLADIIVRQLSHSVGDAASVDGASLTGSDSLNQLALDMAARRVASHSLTAVEQIADQLTQQQLDLGGEGDSTNKSETVSGTELASSFESPVEFVQRLMPMAQSAAEELGVDPRVLVAQAALETGWGRSIIGDQNGNSSNNLFNIKANSGWSGDRVGMQTLEYRDGVFQPERAEFRSYSSLEEGISDYVQFIKENPRYEQARQNAGDSLRYLQELQRAGYATDPEYADKITRILSGETLGVSKSSSQEG